MTLKLENIISGSKCLFISSLIAGTVLTSTYRPYLSKKYPLSGRVPSYFLNSKEQFESDLQLRVYTIDGINPPQKAKEGVDIFRRYALIHDSLLIFSIFSGLGLASTSLLRKIS